MKSQQIRRSFVDFFAAKGHEHLKSATLVPHAFSTTMFTIAGMEQFVPVFLGQETPPAKRAVTVQRCLRVAGGKNDIDNVGRSGRHGTFLEMLGNFSFGDYYKREAILWAWEYLTGTLAMDPQRLHATVYVDDDEAADIWRRDVGLAAERITRMREDNFWDMGATGPCGPCSEIYYDLGAAAGCGREDCAVGCAHCDRYIEFWNLVFQQYDRAIDGELRALPRTCIDTGMGLERVAMILAGKASIFDTDLYQSIIRGLPKPEERAPLPAEEQAVQRRIIADHARATVFLAADGVQPSNTDRGYVMRFLMRRALRSGRSLRLPNGFLTALVPAVIDSFIDGYPDLREAQPLAQRIFGDEERLFDQTLAKGEGRLLSMIEQAKKSDSAELSGAAVFELYDTFGFPPELTAEIAHEHGREVDMAGYRAAMEEQRTRARRDASAKRAEVRVHVPSTIDVPGSQFVGYEQLQDSGAVVAIYGADGRMANALAAGEGGVIVLDRTPFYAERGGQAGDRGVLVAPGTLFDVTDTQYQDKSHKYILHKGVQKQGTLATGTTVDAVVDPSWRREIRRHHSVTHLLQRALKDVIGESVAQRGSAVFPDRTRFDFAAPGALSKQQEREVESRVNQLIRADYHRAVAVMPFAQAVERGAVFMRGENYGDLVRVVTFGPSVELCGGTHVESTGEIGHFILAAESAIAAGIRRVEGVVSDAADHYVSRVRDAAEQAGSVLTASVEQLPESVTRLAHERRDLEKQIAGLQAQLAAARAASEIANAKHVRGISYLTVRLAEPSALKRFNEAARQRWPTGVLALAAGEGDKVSLLVTVSDDLLSRGLSARKILDAMMPHVSGKGGGNAASAQGGGKNAAGIEAAFAAVPEAIASVVAA
ncbi:MAG: alanine--tRNA ligase [Candidatus Eremiobacteraeota bacterium]|nr:alanine--tRNA ligase [Candidatus Eremiobacteraeota bacterium]